MDERLNALRLLVDAPEFMEPWLDLFYEPDEIKLLIDLPQQWTTMDDIETQCIEEGNCDHCGFIHRAWRRGVLDKDEKNRYKAADFHTRYDLWAMFEGFKDVPEDVREQLNQCELESYSNRHIDVLKKVRQAGNPDVVDDVTPRYLLPDEAMAVLDQVERIYLWPCNCRSMIQACGKPIYTCLRFDNNRDIGFEISREKAKEIVKDANKKGLMHSGELGRDFDGKIIGAICNCCSDCCFPHLLSSSAGAEKVWPFSRYVAKYHEDQCTFCGLCSKRCPFDAFTFQRKTKERFASLALETDLCRGCGVCATACPVEAIEMLEL
ncbi:MAG: 4Fe-4S binding protein [Deltaproteobacteria bacterium]|jgi:Pyruvate/2-oxoacid:ferredoxin oxidoreductase delta subunit|nr:4Fe-4S binding protein [Deltaproteobacteria bacterium]